MNTRTIGKITVVFFAVVLLGGFFFLRKAGFFRPLELHSKSAFVINEEGKKEFSKNPDEKLPPASLTKLMTAYTALDKIEDLEEKVPIDIPSYKKNVAANASMAGFYGKEYVTYEDLLYGLLLASGGECAGTLAVRTYGSEKAFVAAMNENALALGMKNTHFTNPEGLDDDRMYSTARDLSILLKAVYERDPLGNILTTEDYTSTPSLDHPKGVLIESTVLSLLKKGEEPQGRILGGKSGTTLKAGLCWATIMKKDDEIYFSVTLGAPVENLKHHEPLQKEDALKILEKL